MQDYNTPPLQGLDGEIYQPGTVDYHAAMTELLLHGFNVGGDPKQFFPPMPADKVAVGFLTGDTTPDDRQSGDGLHHHRARLPPARRTNCASRAAIPAMIGAMFWTIDADRGGTTNSSDVVGPRADEVSGYGSLRCGLPGLHVPRLEVQRIWVLGFDGGRR